LRGLVSSGQQDNHDLAALDEIDPVSGPVINPQFRHAVAHRLGIAGVAERQASDADVGAGTGDSVSQSRKPFGVGFSLLDLDYASMYPMGNIFVKRGLWQLVRSNPRPHQKQGSEN